MRVRLTRDFTFEAAHLLPKAPEGHKCRRLHGHSFRVEVTVEGEADPETGWFLDYAVIRDSIEPIRALLDHYYLNEVPGLANATSENLAHWIWEKLKPTLPSLAAVTIHETCEARCEYEGR
ncbi:MAG: 6-carboxytetrahydropterin synthase QueD [Candidatus Eisenbacteria bacterium]|uniref:6-carboxy-5,6,7,8-tetrahydropterin synthase n=1 Tax=Eiseniibacteriota bacterium TaxID=2212470 RepID=A0A538TCP3_UNCEI|nr:MAG: 6-carboxytetrahydropterin synthase QueD [Candidatus Eisenbacteria bacterium]